MSELAHKQEPVTSGARRAPGPILPRVGSDDIVRLGIHPRLLTDLYHFFLESSWWRLISIIVVLFFCGNVLFALGYLLDKGGIENARPGSFSDAFFFSVQTMATIGYGKMVPRSLTANLLVTFEALSGLLGFAMATGLLFAKFARPTARVIFSNVAIIAMRDGVQSLMFRMANERSNQIVEAQLRLVLLRTETTQEGEEVRKFYDLDLVRGRTAVFRLTWTAIHPITPGSPLFGVTPETLADVEGGLVASLIGLDETFSQTVHARHSYLASEIIWGHRFVDVMGALPDGRRFIDYTHFHDVVPLAKASPGKV